MRKIIAIGAVLGVMALAGCTDGENTSSSPPSTTSGAASSSVSPASAPATPAPSPTEAVDPAAEDQITAVTGRAIEAFNSGSLRDLQDVSCGALRSDLAAADAEAFAAEARSEIARRGRGVVARVSDITVLNEFGSAAVTVRYERRAEGLDAANEVHLSGVYQRTGDTWRICGLSS
ncbi:hypothetical protein ACFYV7_28875 [Nocardia suismassiliense]|uniref:Nuclear transport factor 2 family protein n=1 Tax=Nocardia suismassiliense TaxID=2077092 RepID=A0ABW6R088_9NOCA